MEVTGVDKLVGIDFRPGTKAVFGVTPDHRIVSINLETGAATDVAKMDKMLTMTEAPVVVDFNPAADACASCPARPITAFIPIRVP